jgi:hypothetical protein
VVGDAPRGGGVEYVEGPVGAQDHRLTGGAPSQ